MPRPRLLDASDRLLVAGLALFAQRGCEGVNSNSIAQAAGLGIGTFYLHFANKYALLRALQSRTLSALQRARREAIERAGSDRLASLRASIAAAVEFAGSHPEAYRVCFGRERSAPPHRGPVISESTRALATALERLKQSGELAPELDVELAARAYLAAENGLLLWWLDEPGRAAPAQLVEALIRMHPASGARTTA